MYSVKQVQPGEPLWSDLKRHLGESDHWRWVSDGDHLKEGITVLAAVAEATVIGSIALAIQPVANLDAAGAGEELMESFVQAFHVDPGWRRRGVGRALQLAALETSRARGCYQMRSWSSVDKTGNYRLKLGLGFAFCPAVEYHGEKKIKGGYFVRQLDSSPDREHQ